MRHTPSAVARTALRRATRSGDSGATLLMALIFITVVAVVIGAVLSFVDVSLRTTVAMRAQAAQAAAADGAAQVAINTLRASTFRAGGTGTCFSGGATLQLANFYQPATGGPYSATVDCALDTTDSAGSGGVAITAKNRPGSAILTLSRSGAEDGLDLSATGGRTIKVHGRIYSNSNFVGNKVETNAEVIARGACTATITSTPAAQCNIGNVTDARGDDPDYAPPTLTTAPATPAVPTCPNHSTNKLITMTPGLYTDVDALNDLTNSNKCQDTIWFPPGTYYFNFTKNVAWTVDNGAVVGGTKSPGQVVDGVAPTIPGACQSPIPPDPIPPGGWTNPGPNAGVEFVFGGNSRLAVGNGKVELCGSYSLDHPPIAVYGLKSALGPAGVVPAQSGCTIITVSAGGCSTVTSNQNPDSRLYIQGTTYLPKARVDVALNNDTGQVFRFGIIARSLRVTSTSSADLNSPVIEVPDEEPGGLRTVVYLKVYVCAGTMACLTSGSPQLGVKVGLGDPTGTAVAGAREVTVYSWSVQR